jgi:tetratricopeptide (TPR) repeat protein
MIPTQPTVTLNDLGISHGNLGQYPQALESHQRSLAIRQEIGDRAGEGTTRNNIGGIYDNLGQYPPMINNWKRQLLDEASGLSRLK